MGANEKSMTLGNRHIRQKSLDLNPRPRSRSDAGKKATVGAKIAGIIVPPPPPSVKNPRRLSEPEVKKQAGPVKAIAGIVVPNPPPKVNRTSGTSNRSSTDSIITNEGDNSLDMTNVSPPIPVLLVNEEIIINETVDTPKEKEPEIISYNIEFNDFHEVPKDIAVDSPLPQDSVTAEEEEVSKSELESADKESSEDDSTFAAANTIALGDGEKSPEIVVKTRENDDWYKSMFQSMKKGVEEDIPDKKREYIPGMHSTNW